MATTIIRVFLGVLAVLAISFSLLYENSRVENTVLKTRLDITDETHLGVIEKMRMEIEQLRCNPFFESGDTLLITPLCSLPSETQGYGVNADRYGGMGMTGHNGIDWEADEGTPVRSAHDGVVFFVRSGNNIGYGDHIKIRKRSDTYNGYETVYAHLSKVFVKTGDEIRKGQLIGYVGNTGYSSKSHLHFGIRFLRYGKLTTGTDLPYAVANGDNGMFGWVDPMKYLP